MSTLVDDLSEKLKLEILSGVHPPGARLPPERVLSAQTRINRNSVREALKRLEQMGLVESRHGSGTHVRDIAKEGGLESLSMLLSVGSRELSAKTMQDAMDFRVAYAAGIVELAAERCTSEKAELLMRAWNAMKAAIEPADWLVSEKSYMARLLEAADNRIYFLLQNTLAKAFKESAKFGQTLFSHRDEVETAYLKVLKAVQANQPSSATRQMRELMQAEKSWLLESGSKSKSQTRKR